MQDICLFEAKQHMTPKEKQLHKKLIKLLLDDGKGHHHKKFALRLKDFNIKIVTLKAKPNFTAAISFDLGMIYISEGFLLDDSLFFQLNVLMRHELAHNLLMHQIRMMTHIGETYPDTWGGSQSLHDLLNIIEDMEISHEIYNDEDMDTVRQMYLNGRTIGGILTEDERPEWVDMPVEVMYKKLCEEIDAVHAQIAHGIQSAISHHQKPDDFLTRNISDTINIYSDTQSMSMFDELLDDMAAKGFKVGGQEIRSDFKNIIKRLYDVNKASPYGPDEIEDMIQDIKNCSPIRIFKLIHPGTAELIVPLNTPEQKQFAIEVLKKFRTEEVEWYNAVLSVMKRNNYDAQTVQDIWNKTRGAVNGD
jgi:hypothetical protein